MSGYHVAGNTIGTVPPVPGAYQTLPTQTRLLDTRHLGAAGKLAFGHSLPAAGIAGVPTGSGSVILNVTSTNATAHGRLRVFTTGATLPFASNVNFTTGRTVANEVVVAPSAAGKVSVRTR